MFDIYYIGERKMNTQIENQIEFPLNVNLEEKEEKIHPGVKKLYRFFKYISDYHNSKVNAEAGINYVYIFIEDAGIKIDYDGEISIWAPSLQLEIYRNSVNGKIEIYGNAEGYEFKIKFVGQIKVLVRENSVILTLKVKSLPQIVTY
uniref:Uncharacterized protein n=1 Tax=Sulfolobus islandicus rod-shaped virus 1 TaxID=157898 RepID=Q5W363_SIRV1|nr:hypothetical protein [Sulfolobus islandicus rod-shaped virus 1]